MNIENQEILDRFGKLVIDNIYNDALDHFKCIRSGTTKWNIGKEYTEVFSKLTDDEKEILFKYIKELLNTSIFSFLQIFEENPEFKIIFKNGNGQQIDLNKISEMLKSEHHGEDGWIKKFGVE